jgi:hypothetical protein
MRSLRSCECSPWVGGFNIQLRSRRSPPYLRRPAFVPPRLDYVQADRSRPYPTCHFHFFDFWLVVDFLGRLSYTWIEQRLRDVAGSWDESS